MWLQFECVVRVATAIPQSRGLRPLVLRPAARSISDSDKSEIYNAVCYSFLCDHPGVLTLARFDGVPTLE